MYSKIMFTDIQIAKAEMLSKEMGKLNDRSYMGGERNEIGLLGEELFAMIRPDAVKTRSYDFDFLCNDLRIEVKSRQCAGPPQSYWEIILERIDQECDYYVFCGVDESLLFGYVFGWLSSAEVSLLSKRIYKGAPRPSVGEYKENGYAIPLSCLRSF